MDQGNSTGNNRKQHILNLTLAVLAGQVGCVTLIIVIAAVFFGIWLDSQFHSKPTFTLILTIASIPVSLAIMFGIAQGAIQKIKTQGTGKKTNNEEENRVGKNE